MANPLLSSSTRARTRKHPSSLVNPTSDPEKVLRVGLHKLSSCTLLVNLGHESLFDIHLLFPYSAEQDIMDLFASCNVANIQGYPHDLPENGLDKLPSLRLVLVLI